MEPSRAPSRHLQSSYPLYSIVNSISYSKVYDVNKPNSSLLWYYRLDHSHFQAIKLELKHWNVSIFKKLSSLSWKSCCQGKSHKIHVFLSLIVYKSPFDVVYTNLWGVPFFLLTLVIYNILPLWMHTPNSLGSIFWSKVCLQAIFKFCPNSVSYHNQSSAFKLWGIVFSLYEVPD